MLQFIEDVFYYSVMVALIGTITVFAIVYVYQLVKGIR